MTTPLERVVAVLQHRLPDCVPVFPVMLMQGAGEMGMDLKTYFSRGEYLAEGQLRLLEKFGHDCVLGIPHVVEDISAFGAEIMYYHNGPPSPGTIRIQDYSDLETMTVPDPYDAPMLVETLNAIETLAGEVGGGIPILGACIAPFSLPSMLMGTERWMELLFFEEEPLRSDVLSYILDLTSKFCARWANAQLKAGATAIVLADGMASASVLNRQQFIDLALPVVKSIVPQINGTVIHEGVGDLNPMLDLLPATGVAGVMLTCDDDLTKAKAMVGKQLALIGNLNNIEIRRWTPEQAAAYAGTALKAAAPGGGYILGVQGPEIPLGVSDEVIHALVQAAHNWRY
jgi:uroporphyrinogen decarboxylase